jgi:hypothetical protein
MSGFAMGAVLLQKKEDRKKHPIAYYLKTLSAAERNYNVYDLELLVIVNTLDHWRPYLAGSPHKIIIYSDHQNLLYWKEPHKISRCVVREVPPRIRPERWTKESPHMFLLWKTQSLCKGLLTEVVWQPRTSTYKPRATAK